MRCHTDNDEQSVVRLMTRSVPITYWMTYAQIADLNVYMLYRLCHANQQSIVCPMHTQASIAQSCRRRIVGPVQCVDRLLR